MSDVDRRGCTIFGATPAALEAYEHALDMYQSWRTGVAEPLDVALQEAPAFVMAHLLAAWRLACSRDLRRIESARPVLAIAGALPANQRERFHLAALAAVLGDDYEGAKAHLADALRHEPRDILALQAAHALDYLTGDGARMADRVQAVLPAWSHDVPGYHAVLAMHAFSLEECGDYARAEKTALAALALNPRDARACHVMAHVFEMTGQSEEGIRWMSAHAADWSVDTVVATHCWWHVALFHLAQGRLDIALDLYDCRVRASHSSEVADLIDAASLLWRVKMRGANPGTRWEELADAWVAHIDDGFCSFSDLHAMMAFVGAEAWHVARRLERAMTRAKSLPTRYGKTTREVGLPACRALMAFGRRNHTLAAGLLGRLPAVAFSLGGSHAQREVLHMALARALQRIRRPRDWLRGIRGPSAALTRG